MKTEIKTELGYHTPRNGKDSGTHQKPEERYGAESHSGPEGTKPANNRLLVSKTDFSLYFCYLKPPDL